MEKEHTEDVIQSFMDKAYDLWQDKNWDYEEFLSHLSWPQKAAVVAGNFNYQVGNGGLLQWLTNDYDRGANELEQLLNDLEQGIAHGEINAELNAIQYVRKMVKAVVYERDSRSSENLYHVPQHEWDEMAEELDAYDDGYYDQHRDEFLSAVAQYLNAL